MRSAGKGSRGGMILALLTGILAASPAAAETVAITGATIHTMGDMGTIEGGTLVIQDGVVSAVGRGVEIPSGARIVKADGKVVTPGIIDARGSLGLTEISLIAQTVDHTQAGQRFTASFDVADAINPRSSLIAVNRIEGITRAVVAPTLAHVEGSVIAGLGAVIHLGGPDDYLVRRAAALFVYLDESAAVLSGGSRVLSIAALREALQDAGDYGAHREAYEQRSRREYAVSRPDLEALLPVVNGTIPMVVQTHRASDIEAALRMAAEFELKLVIAGGAEGWMVAQRLADSGVPVILDPLDNLPAAFESLGARLDNAALLHRAGVTIAFSYSGSHNARNVTQSAGNAVAAGLPWEAALQAITINPARIYGLDGSIGSLDTGQEADVVVWSGDPLEVTSFADQVFIRGQPVPMVSRQTLLRDRYMDLGRPLPPAYVRP